MFWIGDDGCDGSVSWLVLIVADGMVRTKW